MTKTSSFSQNTEGPDGFESPCAASWFNLIVAYMNTYSSIKEVSMVCSAGRTAHGDYILDICLNMEGFQAIPHIFSYQDQRMMVVMEGRRLLCRSCRLGRETKMEKTVYTTQYYHRITTASTGSHTTTASYTISTTGTPITTSIGKIPPKKSNKLFFKSSNNPLSMKLPFLQLSPLTSQAICQIQIPQ